MENLEDYFNNYNSTEEKELSVEDVQNIIINGNLDKIKELDSNFIDEYYAELVFAIKNSTSNSYNKKQAIAFLTEKRNIAKNEL